MTDNTSPQKISSLFKSEGVIGTAFLILVAILQFTPNNLLDGGIRFFVFLFLAIVFISVTLLRSFYSDLEEKRKIKREIDQYKDILPKTIRLENLKREYFIKETGDITTIWSFKAINLSGKPLEEISFPVFYDLYLSREEIARCDFKKLTEDAISINKIEVDNEPIPHLDRCIKTAYVKLDINNNSLKGEGNLKIPLSRVDGNIWSEHDISIQFEVKGCMKKYRSEEDIGSIIQHPMDSATIIVHPPEGHQIELIADNSRNKGIKIFELSSKIDDHGEMERVTRPLELEDGKRIVWQIKQPRLGYVYELYFKAVKSG